MSRSERRTMTLSEAARALGISVSHAASCAARDGHLAGVPAIRIGSRVLFSRAAMLDVTAARREPVANTPERRSA